jgi:methylenetetrahydrofolate dehydrogenase (NADP+)/methenyltetrahydrofolate cyclohydrolase
MNGPIIINGRAIAQTLRQGISQEIIESSVIPGLAIIQVGDNPATNLYVKNKQKACEEIGVRFWKYHFPFTTSPSLVQQCIEILNKDSNVHGILLQLPLPPSYHSQKLIDCISPEKDVDGLTTTSVGRLWNGQPGFIPCTPAGCLDLLKRHIPLLKGKIVTILGRSSIVGRPLSCLLSRENATVIMTHSQTVHPEIFCQQSDIVIAAVGKPRLVQSSWIKPGAVIIDVGINRVKNEQQKISIQGDVDFNGVFSICKAITPVPGGVGPMTITYLLKNVLKAAQMRR